MFGYVCPVNSMLDGAAQSAYRASYCGVCRNMGLLARFALSYECAFLALFHDGLTVMPQACRKACPALPLRHKLMALGDNQRYAADVNILLAYHKFRDDVYDGEGIKARMLCFLLYPAKKAAARRRPAAAAWIEQRLSLLYGLEKRQCRDIEQLSDAFASLLQGIAAPGYDSQGALGCFFYDLGRWIYIVDALSDYQADRKAGRFNALLQYETLSQARQAMEFSLWHGLSRMELQLNRLHPSEPAMSACKHILYDVLPAHTMRALGQEGGRKAESL